MINTLTKQEWLIMECLWDDSPVFLSDLTQTLKGRLPWKRGTYQTYLRRMLDKGYIGYDEVRGSRAYYPLLQREQCIRRQSKEMMSVLGGDSAKLMLTCMIEESGLDSDSSEELKQLIDKLAARQDEA